MLLDCKSGKKLGQQKQHATCRARVGSFKTRLISALPPVRTHERDTQEAPIETSLADFCKARLRGFQLSKYALLYVLVLFAPYLVQDVTLAEKHSHCIKSEIL